MTGAAVVLFSWNLDPTLVAEALRRGAAGYLSKTLDGAGLADAVVKVASGERVLPGDRANGVEHGAWPGQEHGLSAREAEMMALITQGFSNAEIAERSYLSINSVKTYIRTAYRKLGLTRRSQAVRWGLEHGFLPPEPRRRPAQIFRNLDGWSRCGARCCDGKLCTGYAQVVHRVIPIAVHRALGL